MLCGYTILCFTVPLLVGILLFNVCFYGRFWLVELERKKDDKLREIETENQVIFEDYFWLQEREDYGLYWVGFMYSIGCIIY